jgi:hypothetical protein
MSKNNKKQGVAHILGIFLLPVLILIGFYVKWIIARVIILGIFVFVAQYLWRNVLKN